MPDREDSRGVGAFHWLSNKQRRRLEDLAERSEELADSAPNDWHEEEALADAALLRACAANQPSNQSLQGERAAARAIELLRRVTQHPRKIHPGRPAVEYGSVWQETADEVTAFLRECQPNPPATPVQGGAGGMAQAIEALAKSLGGVAVSQPGWTGYEQQKPRLAHAVIAVIDAVIGRPRTQPESHQVGTAQCDDCKGKGTVFVPDYDGGHREPCESCGGSGVLGESHQEEGPQQFLELKKRLLGKGVEALARQEYELLKEELSDERC